METLTNLLKGLQGRPDLSPDVGRSLAELEAPVELHESLAGHLRNAVRWLHERGEIDAAKEILSAFFDALGPDSPKPTELSATVLRLLGVTHRLLGNLQDAIDCLARAKVYYELLGDRRGLAMSVNALGAVYASLTYWAIAERCFLEARSLAASEGLVALELKAQRNLVFSYTRQGRFRDARELLRTTRAKAAGPMATGTYALSGDLALGALLRQHGFVARAEKALRRALDAASGRFPHAEGVCHHLLGECALDRGEPAVALKHFKVELAIGFETSPLGDLTTDAYTGLAEAHLAEGDLAGAERSAMEGLQRAERIACDETRIRLFRVRAHAAHAAGDLETSRRHFRDALALATQRGFRVQEAMTLEEYGFALAAEGNGAAAERKLRDAAHLYRSMGLARLARRLERGERARAREARWHQPTARRRSRRPIANGWEAFGLVTRSARLLEELERARSFATTPLAVLIRGETGTGKEPIARAIHALSGRTGLLVDVAPAIPETMLESDLFGCEKGAFTGAETRPGLVAKAENGTLFFDEVGDLPVSLQVKLLRFLETLTYRRVGGSSSMSVNLRVVSATNANLEDKVAKGQFREDLYHRLAAGVIVVPALRERPEDIEPLTRTFLGDLSEQAGRTFTIDDRVLDLFAAYSWPGNVRELRNVVATMGWTASSRGLEVLGEDLVPKTILQAVASARAARDPGAIRRALSRSEGNVSQAARLLGLSRQQLYRRIAELGIEPKDLRSEWS